MIEITLLVLLARTVGDFRQIIELKINNISNLLLTHNQISRHPTNSFISYLMVTLICL